MKIIRYVNAGDMTIEFQDEHKVQINTTYANFKKGIKNPYDISVSTMGYIGEGKYLSKINDIVTPIYAAWRNMLKRCYDESDRYLHPAYENCVVDKEWHNFQTFAAWYEGNFYQVGTERMHIDKDILLKDNKIYSPETCIFVPQSINMVFMNKHRDVDSDLPNGINRCVGGYRSMYNTKSLGVSKTLEEAIEKYNIEKRIHIKRLVEEYGDELPPRIRNILLNW